MNKIYHHLFFLNLLIYAQVAYAEEVILMGQGITDDEIASSIKSPSPPSVSKAIAYIKRTYKAKEDEIDVLNFRNNNITSTGAQQILEYASTLPNLRKLNMHTNRIYDWRGQQGFEDFEKALIALLKKPEFEKLDLRTNNIACLSWYQHISGKTQQAYKIKWTN